MWVDKHFVRKLRQTLSDEHQLNTLARYTDAAKDKRMLCADPKVQQFGFENIPG
jgi:hypothetical protein